MNTITKDVSQLESEIGLVEYLEGILPDASAYNALSDERYDELFSTIRSSFGEVGLEILQLHCAEISHRGGNAIAEEGSGIRCQCAERGQSDRSFLPKLDEVEEIDLSMECFLSKKSE